MKIDLTKDQQTWLLRYLNREWDAEIEYQSSNEPDIEYMDQFLGVYIAILGKAKNMFEGFAILDDIETKKKELKELKNDQN